MLVEHLSGANFGQNYNSETFTSNEFTGPRGTTKQPSVNTWLRVVKLG